MNDYFVVYEVSSGLEVYRGTGPEGSGQYQAAGEGRRVVLVPERALLPMGMLDLDLIKTMVHAQVDADAEIERQKYLTPGYGQSMTYARKEAEARAWLIDEGVDTPFLAAEAPARDMTIEALAHEVIALADAWVMVGSRIEAIRMATKKAVNEATTIGHIVAASKAQWTPIEVVEPEPEAPEEPTPVVTPAMPPEPSAE